jgi:hypothetical protein
MFKPVPYVLKALSCAFLRFFVGLMPEVGKTFGPDCGPDRNGVEEKVSARCPLSVCGQLVALSDWSRQC